MRPCARVSLPRFGTGLAFLGLGSSATLFRFGGSSILHIFVSLSQFTTTQGSTAFASTFRQTSSHQGRIDTQIVHLILDRIIRQHGFIVLILRTVTNRSGSHRFVTRVVRVGFLLKNSFAFPNRRHGRLLLGIQIRFVVFHIGRGRFRGELLLFSFQLLETGVNIGINVIGNVLAVDNFGNGVEFPFVLFQIVILAVIGSPDTGTTILPH
mmetsp:Transcript_10913/g.16706  ORF Transcript_10913/g.16706 Transcript_10913/m.16706 type:complete len:210 (-) Transcript_10913:895-1524(-)